MCSNQFGEYYVYNSDEKEHILEEKLEESYEEGMVRMSHPNCEIDDHVSSKSIQLVPSPIICSLLFPSLEYYLIGFIDDYVIADFNDDLGYVDIVMETLKGNVGELVEFVGNLTACSFKRLQRAAGS